MSRRKLNKKLTIDIYELEEEINDYTPQYIVQPKKRRVKFEKYQELPNLNKNVHNQPSPRRLHHSPI